MDNGYDVDRDICIGCGACTTNGCFELDSENKAVLKKYDETGCKEAKEECPVEAIYKKNK